SGRWPANRSIASRATGSIAALAEHTASIELPTGSTAKVDLPVSLSLTFTSPAFDPVSTVTRVQLWSRPTPAAQTKSPAANAQKPAAASDSLEHELPPLRMKAKSPKDESEIAAKNLPRAVNSFSILDYLSPRWAGSGELASAILPRQGT